MQKNIKRPQNKIKKFLGSIVFTMVFFAMLLISACGNANNAEGTVNTENEEINYSILLPGTYDSKDTAVFVSKDEEEKTLTFFNLEKARKYTLTYDGTTKFYDKYDGALALNQVKEGTIVDVTFLKNAKKLNTLQVSKEAWTNTGVSRFEINQGKRNIKIGSETYKFTDDLIVVQDNKQMEIIDISAVDVLTVSGIGTSVYSVQIEKGHGYLRLQGDEYVIGGWIEVGQSLIQQITEGMLLTVPEGTYDVVISHKKYNAVEKVTINRNEETTLDISTIQGEEVKKGTVLFTVKPAEAKVYVDGEAVDTSGPVVLDYGIHQLMAKADGYKTSVSYLKVAEESAGISIVLDAADDNSEQDSNKDETDTSSDNKNNSVSDNNTSGNTTTSDSDSVSGNQSGNTTTGDYYKVYIDNPSGVEVYVDGSYIGISPVNFKKESGIHVVTLRKSGYETRSYTISVDNEKRDASYSFVELDPEEE